MPMEASPAPAPVMCGPGLWLEVLAVQAVVDADGSQPVLTTNVAQAPGDRPTFEETIIQPCDRAGLPETILGKAGFANGNAVANLETRGIEVLVAVSRPDNQRAPGAPTTSGRPIRPPDPNARPPPEPKAAWRIAMTEKLNTEDAKAKYKRRKCTAKPVFGIIKNVPGFTRFLLTGIEKIKTKWLLVTPADNCKRLCNLKIAWAMRTLHSNCKANRKTDRPIVR